MTFPTFLTKIISICQRELYCHWKGKITEELRKLHKFNKVVFYVMTVLEKMGG